MKKIIAILIALVVLSTSVFASNLADQWVNPTSPANQTINLKNLASSLSKTVNKVNVKTSVTKIVFGVSVSDVSSKTLVHLDAVDEYSSGYCRAYWCNSEKTVYLVTESGKNTLKLNADCGSMFDGFTNLQNLEFKCKIDSSAVTRMSYMFQKTKLSNQGLANFLAAVDMGNVQLMYGMFMGVTTISTADFSNNNLAKAKDLGHMFDGCAALTTIKFPENSSKWVHAGYTYSNDKSVASNSGKFETSSDGDGRTIATNLGQMFKGCTSLKTIDLTGIHTNEFTECYDMFSGCSNLEKVFAPEDFTVSLQKNRSMFTGCTKLAQYSVDADYNLQKGSTGTGPTSGTIDLSNSVISKATPWVTLSGSLVLDGTIHVNLGADFGCFNATDINLEYADYLTNASGAERVKDSENLVANEQYGVNVAAAQMTQVINVEIPIATGKTATRQTSVKAMADAYISNSSKNSEKNLCKALLDYGAYAQKYFKVDTEHLANADNSLGTLADPKSDANYSSMQTEIDYTFDGKAANTTKGDDNNIQTLTAGENFNARFYGNSLVCYSSMCTRHSFALPEGSSFGFDKSAAYKVDVKSSDGTSLNDRVTFGTNTDSGVTRCYIQVNDFAAARIDDSYTVTVTCKATGKAMTIKYSPMCYISGVLNSTDAAGASAEQKADLANLKNLVKAIYQYNNRANTYFNDTVGPKSK